MLKRLFLVIFILQSFATSALAGVDMSQFNQAEKSQMQIMHNSLNMPKMHAMSFSDGSKMNSPMHSMMDCTNCDHETKCHNLMCSSVHAATPFYPQIEMIQSVVLVMNSLIPTLVVSIQYSNSQPETPPPSL